MTTKNQPSRRATKGCAEDNGTTNPKPSGPIHARSVMAGISLIMFSPVIAAALCLGGTAAAQPAAVKAAPEVSVTFSPNGGCTAVCVAAIKSAQKEIRVQAYSFTSEPIAQALIAAKARGVDVQVILDSKADMITDHRVSNELIDAGIVTLTDAQHAIAHNKVIVIDGSYVLTGSFNFTVQAEKRNAENLLVIKDAAVAATYLTNWNLHQKHSNPANKTP